MSLLYSGLTCQSSTVLSRKRRPLSCSPFISHTWATVCELHESRRFNSNAYVNRNTSHRTSYVVLWRLLATHTAVCYTAPHWRGAPTRITWFRSVRWCLAVGLACGDQRRLTGSGSALEVVLHDYALYKSTFTLLYFTSFSVWKF